MSQGLNVFLALTALWLVALLGVYLGYAAGGCEGASTLRQRNGDVECDGLLPVINRRVVGTGYKRATTLQVSGHAERKRDGSFAEVPRKEPSP
jgi:hypothetical protein